MGGVTDGLIALAPLAGALILFVAAHLIPALPAVRARLVGLFGRWPYLIGYSALSLGLIWVIWRAYTTTPYIELWAPSNVTRWVPVIVMAPVCVLISAGLRRPNPFSLGRGGAGYHPARPGILRLTRHPLLWALGLWALGHIPPNGDAAGVLLFAVFAALALGGIPALERRKRARMGQADWTRLSTGTGGGRLRWGDLDPWTLLAATLLYAVLLRMHPVVIGVWPGPV